MFNSDKEYVSVYVSKETAKEIKKLESTENEKAIVQKVAKDLELNIEAELSQLDEDLARYKAACIVFKSELKKVYNEQQEEIEKVIDTQWDVMPKVTQETKAMMSKIKEELLPLQTSIEETKSCVTTLKKEVESIPFWHVQDMLKVVEQIKSMGESSKDILKFVMCEYKRD